eukprot:CAMPEP_0169286736 /NCGR_PEP_ID=MMETSP1016-20121227/59480_1 /TAXON_ID=342587 /ORGANISM="Karlodinium micrum, Strain CCMP2283" /LENGTH=82 /DNA_ID=CAMNT_0009376509 /DNA_START=192 /DNA_END=437 /DNA_ORIENTATION=-
MATTTGPSAIPGATGRFEMSAMPSPFCPLDTPPLLRMTTWCALWTPARNKSGLLPGSPNMKEMDVAGLKTYFKISADGGVLT